MSQLPKRLLVLSIVCVLLTSCQTVMNRSAGEDEATPTPIPTPIVPDKPTYVVKRGPVIEQLEFAGRVSPVEEESLFFKTGGYVKRVLVERDEEVKAGDLLAELEVDDLLKQMAQGEVALSSAQLRLTEAEKSLEKQITQAEMSLAVAEARLAQAELANADAITQAELALAVAQEQLARLQLRETDLDAELLSANIDLTRAQQTVTDAEREYNESLERHQQWGEWGEPQERVDAYARGLQNAQWNLELAQARYNQALNAQEGYAHDLAVQELAVEQAQANLDKLQRGVDPMLAIEVQRAQQEKDWLVEGVDPVLVNEVNQAQLNLERLEGQVAEAQIVAPIDGIVLTIGLIAGRAVEAFDPVIVVADPSAKELSANLTSTELSQLVEGQPADIIFNASPNETWTGAIRLLPYPYGTGGSKEDVVGVDESTRIGVDGDLSEFDLGDLARVIVTLDEADDTLWLPPAAIRNFQGRRFVIVQDEDRQRRVDITVGIEGTDRIEVLEGLEEGQIVLGQ
jgi:multidrug efflux pump subunit AcrA (membrane-fusion protein)